MINNVVYGVLRYLTFHSVPVFFSLFKWSEGFKIYKLTTMSHSVVKENSSQSSCALLASLVQFAFSKAHEWFFLLDDPISLSWSGSRWECWPISPWPLKSPHKKKKLVLHYFLNFEKRLKISPSHCWWEWGCLRTSASPNIVFKDKLCILLSPSSPRSSGSFGKVTISSFESLSQHIGRHLYVSFIPAFCEGREPQGEKTGGGCHAKIVSLFSVNV